MSEFFLLQRLILEVQGDGTSDLFSSIEFFDDERNEVSFISVTMKDEQTLRELVIHCVDKVTKAKFSLVAKPTEFYIGKPNSSSKNLSIKPGHMSEKEINDRLIFLLKNSSRPEDVVITYL